VVFEYPVWSCEGSIGDGETSLEVVLICCLSDTDCETGANAS